MAMFGTKKTKPSEGSDLVLAYLEDAQRVRAALVVFDAKGRETPASLVAVTEERVTLSVQERVLADKGDSVTLLFHLDGLRFKTSSRTQESKAGTLTLDLPAAIDLAERRKNPRARLNQREGATAIALTGLFDGIGLTGTIDNISGSGMCLKVGRAMNVKTQGPMHLGTNLLSVGQVFLLMKLSKLPKCPLIELAGTATHVASEGGLLSVGIAFEPGKDSLLAPIRSLVSSRSNSIPTSVPPKARRSQEAPREEEPAIELAAAHPPARKDPPAAPEPVTAPAPVAAPPPEPVHPSEGAEAAPEAHHRGGALLRVKKRTRNLLLAMPEGPEREALAGFLAADGYGQVLAVAALTELLDALDRA